MDTTQIIAFSLVLVVVAFRLYKKYYKKDLNSSGSEKGDNNSRGFFSKSSSDDYEPYSKK